MLLDREVNRIIDVMDIYADILAAERNFRTRGIASVVFNRNTVKIDDCAELLTVDAVKHLALTDKLNYKLIGYFIVAALRQIYNRYLILADRISSYRKLWKRYRNVYLRNTT